jgi:hypothetical protein
MPLLYELLNQLNKKEIRQLKKYLKSPFVTHREDIGRMFDYLAKHLYESKPLPSKVHLFKHTYGEEVFDAPKLRSTMSELRAFIEQYIIGLSGQQDEIRSLLSLGTFYRQRNLPRHFQRTIKKVKKLQARQALRNPDYYQHKLDLQIEEAHFASENKRTQNLNLQEIDTTLDVLYLSQKLRHACTLLSHRAVFQADYSFGLLKGWIDLLEESAYLNIPAIALYYHCYRFLTEAYSQDHFVKFRQALSLHHAHFPKDELKDLYRAAINFCIRKLNEGNLGYTREGWELYQEGLSAGYFIENEQLSRFTFDNIVGFGLRLKEYKAVGHFINVYQQKLNAEFRARTVAFNLARLEYEQQNFSQALSLLLASNPKDLVNQLITKTLQLKIYYESGEFDLLDSHLDSFRSFIRRREVSDYHRENYHNIIHFIRKIVSLAPYDKMERKKLKEAITNTPVLTEREWLLQKIGQM